MDPRSSHLCGQLPGLCCPGGALQTHPSFTTGQLRERPQLPWHVFRMWKCRQKGVPLGAAVAQEEGHDDFALPLSFVLDFPLPLGGEGPDLTWPLDHWGCRGDQAMLLCDLDFPLVGDSGLLRVWHRSCPEQAVLAEILRGIFQRRPFVDLVVDLTPRIPFRIHQGGF